MTREEASTHLEVLKGECGFKFEQEALDMAISALSAEGEYIKKEDAKNCYLKWRPYMATRIHEYEKEMSELPTYSFPEREKGERGNDER